MPRRTCTSSRRPRAHGSAEARPGARAEPRRRQGAHRRRHAVAGDPLAQRRRGRQDDDQPHPGLDGQRRPGRRVLEPGRRRARADHIRRGPHARADARRCERRRHRTGRHLLRVRDHRPVQRRATSTGSWWCTPVARPRPSPTASTIPNVPTANAPAGWDYYLISWTSSGIAFARVPTGGCGCGSFDMQMQSAYSATINPVTEVVTPLTASWIVPAQRRRARHADRVLRLGLQRQHHRPAHHQRRRASPQLRDVGRQRRR